MEQQGTGEQGVLALAAELQAEARAVGVELPLDDALVVAIAIAPLLAQYAEQYDAWAAQEEARTLGLLDAEHLALDSEVARLVAAG